MKTLCAALLLIGALFAPAPLYSKTAYGIASWYGPWHDGKRMANGHVFHRYWAIAASRTIPLGTRVRVKYLKTGRTVLVTVTDRGPYVGHRIMDLSEGAATVIGMKKYGLGKVELTYSVAPHHRRHKRKRG